MKDGHKIGFARSEKQREREGRGGEFSGGRTGGGDRVGGRVPVVDLLLLRQSQSCKCRDQCQRGAR